MKELIPDAAVKAIQDSVKVETIGVADNNFVTRQVFNPPAEPVAAQMRTRTLASIIDYLASDLDKLTTSEIAIVVDSQTEVRVIGALFGRHRQRETLIVVEYEPPSFRWDQWYDCESFNIALQSMFIDNEDRGRVLSIVGNIKEENVRTAGDDGVTQTVTQRAGIVRAEEVSVPNPVKLQPYRTFAEVAQPESPFVLRMKQGSAGHLPSVALFEADGGQWKLESVKNIATYFRVRLAELNDPLRDVPILA